MFPAFTKHCSRDDMVMLNSLLEDNQLPDSMSNVGSSVSAGTEYNAFNLSCEDKSESYTVQVLPVDKTQTVTDSATIVDYSAYFYTQDSTWHVPPEDIEYDVLPELRQSFYEGDSFDDREADFKYHFGEEDTEVAIPSSNPVSRLDDSLFFVSVEFLGGMFPRKWLLSTKDKDYYYLRERSGSIKLISDAGEGEIVFSAYIGGEHPGTSLKDREILDFITSVEYINISDEPEDSVPEEAHNRYWDGFGDIYDASPEIEYDDLIENEDNL